MVCLRTSPKNPEELYKFFMEVARPPVKSHVIYIGSQFVVREDWMIYANLSKSGKLYGLWFHYKESDPAKWYEVYEKYLYENETTRKHR